MRWVHHASDTRRGGGGKWERRTGGIHSQSTEELEFPFLSRDDWSLHLGDSREISTSKLTMNSWYVCTEKCRFMAKEVREKRGDYIASTHVFAPAVWAAHNLTIPKLLHSSVYDLEARISRIDEFSTRNGNLGQDHPGKGTERLMERGAEGEKQCPSRLLLT